MMLPLFRIAYHIWDLGRTQRAGQAMIAAKRAKRLHDILHFARGHSPLYRELYQGLPEQLPDLEHLPVVTKKQLVSHFEDWITDKEITRAGVQAFTAEESHIGQEFLGRYTVWVTSGTTGTPCLFINDRRSIAIYLALLARRVYWERASARDIWKATRKGWRIATIMGQGSHFASVVVQSLMPRPTIQNGRPQFSVLMPLSDIVEALNTYQPAILNVYPSMLDLLTKEQELGHLKIGPALIVTGGETLPPDIRHHAQQVFDSTLSNFYAASEFMGIAYDCGQGSLHLNSDWLILEPVDADYHPVANGTASHTTLLTNLANRIQPIIRYDLGDSITMKTESCSCSSPFPAFTVEGRSDEVLCFRKQDGHELRVVPLALGNLVYNVAGVQRFQVIQETPVSLRIRLEIEGNLETIWQAVHQTVQDYFVKSDLPNISIRYADEVLAPHPGSGKFRQVWSEVKLEAIP
jgi:phenylacetate-coenzyme A ligase PaaK-like adenylate-forming protein